MSSIVDRINRDRPRSQINTAAEYIATYPRRVELATHIALRVTRGDLDLIEDPSKISGAEGQWPRLSTPIANIVCIFQSSVDMPVYRQNTNGEWIRTEETLRGEAGLRYLKETFGGETAKDALISQIPGQRTSSRPLPDIAGRLDNLVCQDKTRIISLKRSSMLSIVERLDSSLVREISKEFAAALKHHNVRDADARSVKSLAATMAKEIWKSRQKETAAQESAFSR